MLYNKLFFFLVRDDEIYWLVITNYFYLISCTFFASVLNLMPSRKMWSRFHRNALGWIASMLEIHSVDRWKFFFFWVIVILCHSCFGSLTCILHYWIELVQNFAIVCWPFSISSCMLNLFCRSILSVCFIWPKGLDCVLFQYAL